MQQGFHRRLYQSRIFLIVYSCICTVWLIIRTGRRPNRFVYPCQRAAASQSLWLWSYLIGSSPSFISKFFNRENSLPRLKDVITEFQEFRRLFLAVALMTGVFIFSFNHPDVIQNQNVILRSRANLTLSTPNFSATLADSSYSKSVVAIIGSDNPLLSQPTTLDRILTYNQVKDMVWTALDADTSSKSLKEVINDSDWVVIKPNIVTAPIRTISGSPVTYYWYQRIPHKGQNTDLRVVKAVIEYLVQNKNLQRITIAEGSGEWAKLGEAGTDPNMAMDGWTVHWQEYDNLSYEQIRDEINATHPGLVDLVDLSYDGYRYVEVPDPYQSGIGGLQRSGYYMPNTVLDCDKWIDIAAMKTHSIPGLSLAMKLRIGTLANQAYGPAEEGYMELHSYGAPGVKQAIIDMYSYRPADYAIVEGIWSTEGDGPQWGNDIKRNVIVAGHNAVAVDAIGATIMGYNPWDLDYLHLATMKKLGTFNPQQIEIIGDSINHVAINFTKPNMEPENTPYVGRGNRNWLVNGFYSSADLSIDFLGNESLIQPFEGMISGGNTWQLFESSIDKIDLKQVFGSNADNCIVYAFVYVNSSKNITTNLWIGVDDGVKVWVNSQIVFSEDQAGAYMFPEHKIPISLNHGTNTILCKILNYSQDFEFRMNTSDNDGDTPLEIEYLTTPPNVAPNVPQLLSPLDNDFIANILPTLSWTIPADINGDSLHFLVQVSTDSNFTYNLQIYNSYHNSTGFSPTPPVPAGNGTMSFKIQTPLSDEQYWWRVAAWDGNNYSDFSSPRQFIVDTTSPEISNLGWDNPGYVENWYNQEDTTIARLKIIYTEMNADCLAIIINALGNPLLYNSLPEETDQTFHSEIEIQNASDGSHPIVVELWDRAGNSFNDTILINLDSTSPVNTQASSPDTSVAEAFIVNWAHTGSDGDGVGLSGLYDVRFKIDNGQWQDWLTRFSGTADTFKIGEHGHNYYFEVAAWDYLGNREAFSETPESSTLVDTTAANIAPQKPVLISPVNKKYVNTTTPQLTWAVPADGNDDSLHFNLQLSKDNTFSNGTQSYSSILNATHFSPSPPYPQGIGTIHFRFSTNLSETKYWWKVSAFDGLIYRSFSEPYCFRIDITPPIIQSISKTEPNCSPNWYNQKLNPIINVKLNYQEDHASQAKLFCNSVALSIVKQNIPSGNFCTVDFEIDIATINDGNYLFNASIIDSAENTITDTFSIQLDSTPPKGATASTPDTSKSLSFMVDWQNTASDSGSGLSGKYDIQVKIDDGQFETWRMQHQGTSCEFSEGKHGHRYAIEVAAWDRAGNREPFMGVAESTTLVDTLTSAVNQNQFISQIPDHYFLKQNYPNPFNNSTCIEFGLPEAGRVRLTIYDLMGRTIKNILLDEMIAAGTHRFYWDGTDSDGNRVASSLYIYEINATHYHAIKKLLFLK